jgi:hypothetical protein
MSRTEQARIERRRGYERKYYANPANRHKDLARGAIADAIRAGKLTPPLRCEQCGLGKPEAHHEDYSKTLDVKWLCRQCHKGEHQITHCKNGHALTQENVYVRPNCTKRACRICRQECMREFRRSRKPSRRVA